MSATIIRFASSPTSLPAPREPTPVAWLKEFARRWGTRRLLLDLDDQMLRDIGVTRAEAEFEAGKPFWRA